MVEIKNGNCMKWDQELNGHVPCIDNGKLCNGCSVYAGNAKLPNQFRSKS